MLPGLRPDRYVQEEYHQCFLKPLSNGHNMSQHLLRHVVRCWDHTRSSRFNNFSTFQEQKKCREKFKEFKLVSTCHNTCQHCRDGWSNAYGLNALNKCWENVVTNFLTVRSGFYIIFLTLIHNSSSYKCNVSKYRVAVESFWYFP